MEILQVFEGKEIIDYLKPLDYSWFYSKNHIDGFKLKILEPEIIIRNNYHVENCGKLIYEQIN